MPCRTVPAVDESTGHVEADELEALASFAATPEGLSALAKLPALGAILIPIVERQIADAERDFRAR